MSGFDVVMIIFVAFFFLLAGIGMFYAIGICSNCDHWSMKYVCPSCNKGRYDYT